MNRFQPTSRLRIRRTVAAAAIVLGVVGPSFAVATAGPASAGLTLGDGG